MELEYHFSTNILLSEEIKSIPKKSKNLLQPLFEALMNSFKAIENLRKGNITICFSIHKDLFTEKSGTTNIKNCQMFCRTHNQAKGDK
jgi:hypothetical protein